MTPSRYRLLHGRDLTTVVVSNVTFSNDSVVTCAALLAVDLARAETKVEDYEGAIDFLEQRIAEQFRDHLEPALNAARSISVATLDTLSSELDQRGLAECLSRAVVDGSSVPTRQRQGMVHTTHAVAKTITNEALWWWRTQNPDLNAPQLLGDLSCGSGVFLMCLQDLNLPSSTRIVGADTDLTSILSCELLRARLDAHWELVHIDSLLAVGESETLFDASAAVELRDFDLLVGNPPYVRSSRLEREYINQLRHAYKTLPRGNFDLSIAFIEQATRCLKPNGVFSYITSSKFMKSEYGRALCALLTAETRLLAVDDFGDAQVFPGLTTYVAVITAAAGASAARFRYETWASVDEYVLTSDSPPSTGNYLPKQLLESFPWSFSSTSEQAVLRKLGQSRGWSIKQVFSGVFQGIRTGSNSVFILPADEAPSVESVLQKPLLTGREIRRQTVLRPTKSLLFPYVSDDVGQLRLLLEQELKDHYPRAYSYLSARKEELMERNLDQGECWFAFSRSQNLDGDRVRKIFVKEMMPRSEFAHDCEGSFAFSSGYAIDASNLSSEEIIMWTAILNTPTMEFALRSVGTQLHSGWFRLLKHHLLRLKLPELTTKSKGQAIGLARTFNGNPETCEGREALVALDTLVARVFGLNAADQTVIAEFLGPIHERSCKSKSATSDSEGSTQIDYEPVRLERYESYHRDRADLRRLVTFKDAKSQPIHRWFPYTQGYDEGLVGALLDTMGIAAPGRVLDPFGGVGTTAIACRKIGFKSTVVDISPLATWIAQVKNSEPDSAYVHRALEQDMPRIAEEYANPLHVEPELFASFFEQAYAPSIFRRILNILGFIRDLDVDEATRDFLKLMLIGKLESLSNLRKHGSHYRFLNNTSSVGLHRLNIDVVDPQTSVADVFREATIDGLQDLETTRFRLGPRTATIRTSDARRLPMKGLSVDAVVTSPPYLNRNNYVAQQKGELALLGLIQRKSDYRALVKQTFASHVEADLPKEAVSSIDEVQQVIAQIQLTEGNNPKIPNMIAGYFEDLRTTVRELYRVCRPSAPVAMVVGNTRWGGVVVPVDHILMLIAEMEGFVPERILVTRMKGNSPQQMRKFGRIPVRESVVIFRKV